MRVWIVNHYAVPPTQGGGTRHFAIADELIRRGHEVMIVASNINHLTRRGDRRPSEGLSSLEKVCGVPFLWVRTPAYQGNGFRRLLNMAVFAARIQLRSVLREFARPDVIVGSSPDLFAALAAERVARALGVPFILEVRDLWPQTFIDLGRVSPGNPIVRGLERIEKYLYRHADHIVTLLPGAADHIAAKGGARDRITWIPNGVAMGLVPPATAAENNDVFTVTYAGAHGFANGLDAILDAAAQLQQDCSDLRIRFRFLGEGTEKARLEGRVRTERLKNVRFDPAVPKQDVYRELQKANAFVVNVLDSPLYRYGVSLNKFFDYLVMARPTVVASGAMNNPFEECGAGIGVAPNDSRAIARAVQTLAEMDATERWGMGMRGRAFVEEHYSFARLTDRLEEVLTSIIQRNAYSPI